MYVELRIANAPTKLLEALGAMDAALAVTILQAIATTIIGAIALYFARMQALTGRTQAATNQKEFRLRFFDRRIGVYDAVMELCACIAKDGYR
jgi:chloramphenicol O-acetyltransferase